MYHRIFQCYSLLIIFSISTQTFAQVSGKALYDLMAREPLVKTEGITRVTWLPNGVGYLDREIMPDSAGYRFFKVNPQTGDRTPLFSDHEVESMVKEYEQVSRTSVSGMPCTDFSYVLSGNAIRFQVDEKEYIYSLTTEKLRQLRMPEIAKQPDTDGLMRNMEASQLWNGTLSPDFTQHAYVKDYDIYLYDTITGEEEQLTLHGSADIMNGQPDWVYPEELQQTDAYWWSHNSKQIAYLQYDVRNEYRYPLVYDLQPHAAVEWQRYPKAGDKNPIVKLFVVDVETKKAVEIQTGSSSDMYIYSPQWRKDDTELLFLRLNRLQKKLELMAANPHTGAIRTILIEEDSTYIHLFVNFYLLDDNQHFLWKSERDGWMHVYLYDLQGKLKCQLTKGTWEVNTIVNIDEKNQRLYFTAFTERGLEHHFFRVNFDGTELTQLTSARGMHRISMDPAGLYYVDDYSSLETPRTINLFSADGTKLKTLASSEISRAEELGLRTPEVVWCDAADGVTELCGFLFKPADFDPQKKYPLLVSIYNGPYFKANFNFYQTTSYRARLAQLGFIVWELDGRGTAGRGKDFMRINYLQLGQIEVDDQAAAVQQLAEKYSFIDSTRVGIFGHSYGGYMTCLMLFKYADLFHVGVAGAPVTDWRNYDTICTEQYMSTPQLNPDGYDKANVLNYAKNLRGKLLLIHGAVDNNVHPGNTMQLVDALQKAGKPFDLMLYPNQRHGIRGQSGLHYRNKREAYFVEHLKPEHWQETLAEIWK